MKNKKGRRFVNNNRFAQVPAPKYNRSMFKRIFGNKFTFDEGKLFPIFVDEVYGGDTIQGNLNTFIRMTTPLTPTMDNIEFDLHCFFIPSRLVMTDYYKMMGEQVNPTDSTNVLIPVVSCPTGGYTEHSLADYFGLPTKVDIPEDDLPIALPFRAYNLIYNDWFRDENLQDSLPVNTGLDDDDYSNYNIVRRNKKHDYFTSCLPFAQKGEAVNLPLGGQAGLVFDNVNQSVSILNDNTWTQGGGLRATTANQAPTSFMSSVPNQNRVYHNHTGSITSNINDVLSNGYADLGEATSITINSLREALSIQHILERRARSGTRDVEILQSTYGVSPSDDRMQRPELISVSRSALNMSTVAQTSETTGNSPLGDLSAIGTIRCSININYSAVENGFIMVLASARADNSYQQGLPKMWNKRSFLDILDPLRAHIGEQPVLRKEIFATNDTEYNNEVFGYLPNFDDLRFGRNQITGGFRSNATDSFDIWHYSQEFSSANPPVLGAEFIQQNAPIERTLAITNVPQFFGDMYFSSKYTRVLPVHSIPGLKRF